jgi:hypothetical protein
VQGDTFAPGSPLNTNAQYREYGYLFGTRTATNTGPTSQVTLTVVGGPSGKRQLVAVSYLKSPSDVLQMPQEEQDTLYTNTFLEWPDSMAELLVSVTHRQMTIGIGDGTTAYQLSTEEITTLFNALM